MSDIPPHRHCPVCGISIPPEEEFCSKKCERAWQEAMRKRKRSATILWVLMGVLVAVGVWILLGS